VARAHAARSLAEERAERATILAQQRRFPAAQHITRLLLQHRTGLVLDTWAEYWLDVLAETIDDRDTPAERARFTGWLESFVRAIHSHARKHKQPPTSTDEAHHALTLATEFIHQETPETPAHGVFPNWEHAERTPVDES